MNARRLSLTCSVSLLPVACALALGLCWIGLAYAAPASASTVHAFRGSFGSEGSGPGQFTSPGGVAVNEVALRQAGDVYVADTGGNRVEWFTPEGTELAGEWSGSETPAGAFESPTDVAIDNSTNPLDPSAGDVYIVDAGHDLVDKFDSEGKYIGQIIGGAGGAPFEEIRGLAVDANGEVWIYDSSQLIDRYSDGVTNAFILSREDPFGPEAGFAVNSADDLYVNRRFIHRFAELTSEGGIVSEGVNPEGNATAAAVDFATDDVYIDEGDESEVEEHATISEFSASGAKIEQFGLGHLRGSKGVAVDGSSKVVYATNERSDTVSVFANALLPEATTTSVSGTATEGDVTLNGLVNPEGVEVTSCAFEYGTESVTEHSVPCQQSSAEIGSGSTSRQVSADLSGLEVAQYHYRLVAGNANGEAVGADNTFVASGIPVITGASLSEVGATTAKIATTANPSGLSATYEVQYGTSTEYGSSTPLGNLGSGTRPSGIQISLSGLSPATQYHARLVVHNERATVTGPDIVFTTRTSEQTSTATSCPNKTFSGFVSSLPDCRAYEDVSIAGGPGEVYVPYGPEVVTVRPEDITSEVPMRASTSGDAAAYVGEAGEVGGSGSSGRGLGNQFLATRAAAGHRWDVSDITPELAANEEPPQYETFSADLSVGIFNSDSPALAAGAKPQGVASCSDLYYRNDNGANQGEYHALFTETHTPGFCGYIHPPDNFSPQNLFVAGENEGTDAVAPNSHVLLQSPAVLADGAEQAVEGEDGANLYVSVDGPLSVVNVLPSGEPAPDAVFGGPPPPPLGAEQTSRPDFSNVISADGSRIFWTDLKTGQVYARENGTNTVPVSTGSAKFWTATPDGRYVFYTEGERLWRFDTQAEAGPEREELGTGVQGVIGTSEDGSYVYFVSTEALAPGAEDRDCSEAQVEIDEKESAGTLTEEEKERLEAEQATEEGGHLPPGRGCNVYLRRGTETTLVTALGAKDDRYRRDLGATAEAIGDWQPELGARTAEVTSSGRQLVFESTQQLTGYDNSSLTFTGQQSRIYGHPERGIEVFVYDSQAGALPIACASCDPSGAVPAAQETPGTYLPLSLKPTYTRRLISEDGSRVFFDTTQPLVSQDTNGVQDVYEWEREGTESCPTASSRFGGCVFLLSGGDSSDSSFLVDASADGGNVFFTHRGELSGVGVPGKVSLFDARAGGGFPESATACTGTGCQGVPPAPPSFATPSSATFSGVGNFPPAAPAKVAVKSLTRAQKLAAALKTCRRDKKKSKRAACEKTAHKKYGVTKHAKKASNDRGAE
jgi:hypothetical protein